MTNKTISINPALFSLSGTKTKKNRPNKKIPKPIISPNILKNKLLNRIKEHKQKETQNLENNKKKLNNDIKPKNTETELNFNDEFTESLNYLQNLSKEKILNETKIKKQKQKEELERKTIRNYHSLYTSQNNTIQTNENTSINPINIQLELPEELLPSAIPNTNTNTNPLKLNIHNDVPYGILKGGKKPSYREWSKTQKNIIVTNPNASLLIDNNKLNENDKRDKRLNLLREKLLLKNKENENYVELENEKNLIKYPISLQPNPQILNELPPQKDKCITEEKTDNIVAIKHITKKTIKKKYTLGKSKIKKTVGILIKDRGTRKKIINAQKELKKKNINDIKQYLREHNQIKIGSTAPNDVLRKMYESSMLAGEITNSNQENLLYNFSKEDKEL